MWKFSAGTAETIVSPLYNVLKSRGVKFNFFHKVEKIHYSNNDEIEKVTIGEQVKLTVPVYQPFIRPRVHGLDCWPDKPNYDQIDPEQARQLQEEKINLESNWSGWKNYKTHVLEKGKDFDQIICGIAISGLDSICHDIINKSTPWQSMMTNVATVQTQGVQLWLNKTNSEMGMNKKEWGIPMTEQGITDTYANPINSWVDMTNLIQYESWKGVQIPKNLAYFCGPMRDSPDIWQAIKHPDKFPNFPKEQDLVVRQMTLQWLNDNIGFLWADATTHEAPEGLDLDLLVVVKERLGMKGWERLQQQFFRANIDPAERYTLSLPDSAKYRMKTDDSGYTNLFLCGDWIDTGYNMGCVEVTVMSGLMAAQAVRKTYGLRGHKAIIKDL